MCSAQSVPVGAISYLVTLYESIVSQRQRRGIRFVHCMTLTPSYPTPLAAKRPLTESRRLPKMPPLGISTRADTHLRIHNNGQYAQRETGGTDTHTDTPQGKEEREDTVMGETDMEKLIR